MPEFPRGMVLRLERQKSHTQLVRNTDPKCVMMKITHARRIMKDGLTFSDLYGDDVSVITTSTVADRKLNLIGWERDAEDLKGYSEFDIIRETEPDFHIPTDNTIYEDMDEAEQREAVQFCIEGTYYMFDRVAEEGLDTTLIPLVKGRTKEQRQMFYDMLDDLGRDYAAFYATQYYTGGYGVKAGDLISDIEKISFEHDPELLTVGALSPHHLGKMPTNVVAGSGQNQWRKRVNLRGGFPEEQRRALSGLRMEVEEALAINPYEEKDISVHKGSGDTQETDTDATTAAD